MTTQLELFAASFENEAALRGAIEDLLNRMPTVSGVQITHGSQEYGKDLVFRTQGGLGESFLCACVVKYSRLSGAVDDTRGAMTVLHQVKQCLTIPFLTTSGEKERVSRVYVMTPYDISPVAMNSITGELQDRSGQVVFKTGGELLELFEQYYSDYLLLKSGLLTSYVSTLRQAFEDVGPLHHLSIKHGMLGTAKRATSRAFVQPEFYIEVRSFGVSGVQPPFLQKLRSGLTANEVGDLTRYLDELHSFLQLCLDDSCGRPSWHENATHLRDDCIYVVAVGTAIADRPPHRSVRAELPHTAPA